MFPFMDRAFNVYNNSLPNPRSPGFSPMLYSRSFILLHFTFRSNIHFELIFVKGIRSVPRFFFFFLVCGCPLVPVPFVERTILSPLNCLCSFVKD